MFMAFQFYQINIGNPTPILQFGHTYILINIFLLSKIKQLIVIIRILSTIYNIILTLKQRMMRRKTYWIKSTRCRHFYIRFLQRTKVTILNNKMTEHIEKNLVWLVLNLLKRVLIIKNRLPFTKKILTQL